METVYIFSASAYADMRRLCADLAVNPGGAELLVKEMESLLGRAIQGALEMDAKRDDARLKH